MSPFWRPRGCVLWLDFNEPSGSTAYDKSGYGNHGTIYGAQRVRALGRWGLKFDGVDDYVRIPRAPELEPSVLTLEALFRLDGIPPVAGHIIDHYGSDGGYFLRVRTYDTTPKLQAYVRSEASAQGIDANVPVEPNKWYHGVFVADGSYLRLYLNAVNVGQMAQTISPGPLAKDVYVGAYKPDQWLFEGIISLVRIYNRALSEHEIRANYDYFFGKARREV